MTYHYALDFFRNDGAAIAQVPISPDWSPAFECVHFEGVRRGELPAVMAAGGGTVEPIWHATAGEPFVEGLRVALPANGNGNVVREIPTAYFRGLAQRASAELVDTGKLASGEIFRYLVSAFPAARPTAPDADAAAFSVEEIPQPLPLIDTSLASFSRSAVDAGADGVDGDPPVFVRQQVVDEAVELAARAGDIETGGVLVGQLHHDRGLPEVFVEVTAQIAAPHTEANSAKLTFTAETWAAVRAALALRKRGELMVGWWHSHPDFCRLRDCPLERRKQCTASSAFFSSEDVALHTTLFTRAYNTALLISDSALTGRTASLFGWRRGIVVPRGFCTL